MKLSNEELIEAFNDMTDHLCDSPYASVHVAKSGESSIFFCHDSVKEWYLGVMEALMYEIK